MDAEKCLKFVYYTPSNEGSFGGKKRLKEAVFKDTGVHMSDKQVSEWLAGEDAYTLHKPARINYRRNRVIVHGIDIQFQADLVDMSIVGTTGSHVSPKYYISQDSTQYWRMWPL